MRRSSVKLQMHPVVVEASESDEVVVSQPGGAGAVRVSVEQVPFLVELLQQAKSCVENERYRRANG
jgi:hypothetical protein